MRFLVNHCVETMPAHLHVTIRRMLKSLFFSETDERYFEIMQLHCLVGSAQPLTVVEYLLHFQVLTAFLFVDYFHRIDVCVFAVSHNLHLLQSF